MYSIERRSLRSSENDLKGKNIYTVLQFLTCHWNTAYTFASFVVFWWVHRASQNTDNE